MPRPDAPSPDAPRADVPRAAARQAGTFTRPQAYDDGWTVRQVRRRLHAKVWKVVAGQGLTAGAQTIGRWQLGYAVRLTWPAAVISHELAAAFHGFPVPLSRLGTATLPLDHSRHACGLVAHRIDLAAEDITRFGRLRVTTMRRTALDLLRSLDWDAARDLWAWLSTRGRLSAADLELALDTGRGRHGSAQVRRLLKASARGSLSAAEDRLHALLAAARLTGWRANAPIVVGGRTVAVVDVLFAAQRLVIEVDGFAAHSGRESFQRDRSRQNALVNAGFTVLRFTWPDLVDRPESVVATIRTALARTRVAR